MGRANAQEWAKRVALWRESGLTAKEYAAAAGLNAGTLCHWAWKLGSDASSGEPSARPMPKTPPGDGAKVRSAALPRFVELSAATVTSSSTMLELVLGELRVRVPAGFDEQTLGRVLRIVGACP